MFVEKPETESERRVQESQMDKTGDPAQEWKKDPASPRARARCRGIALLQYWGWGGDLAARGSISPDFPNATCLYQKLTLNPDPQSTQPPKVHSLVLRGVVRAERGSG